MSAPLQMNASNAYAPAWITMPARECGCGRAARATDQTIQPVPAKLANWANKTTPDCGIHRSVGVNPASRRLRDLGIERSSMKYQTPRAEIGSLSAKSFIFNGTASFPQPHSMRDIPAELRKRPV
jgi:hypothetical protein